MSCRQQPLIWMAPEVRGIEFGWFRDGKKEIERLDEIQLLQNENSKLRIQNEKLLDQNAKLRDNINDLITCQICFERFQSGGEHIPCKLECPHIMCKKCAEEWLKNVSLYYLSKV